MRPASRTACWPEADPDGPWRDRALALAAQALSIVDLPDFAPFGVWSGLGGLACLSLDLIHGTSVGFPGVEAWLYGLTGHFVRRRAHSPVERRRHVACSR